MVDYNYSMIRIICQGKIKTCDFCREEDNNTTVKEGYCSKCGRPLWKKSGEHCGFILGYQDKNYKQQNKIHIKCKFCNTVTSI
jgi:hypothetical protein